MSPDRTYRDTAIVLRGRAFGEADRILTLLTRDHGKIDAIAKGIRRPRTRLAGLFEIASEVALECHHGRNLDVITDAEILEAHWQKLLAPERYAALTIVLECIDSSTERGDPQPEIYALLRGMLGALGRLPDSLSLLPRFELRLLALLGFGIEWRQCVRCGQDIGDAAALVVIEEGGVVCETCRRAGDPNAVYTAAELRALAALSRSLDDPNPPLLRANGRIATLAHDLLIHQLGKHPRSENAVRALLEIQASAPETSSNETQGPNG